MKMDGIRGTLSEADYLIRQAREKAMGGDHATAISYLKELIDSNPRFTAAFALLGDCQSCTGQNEAAIASYNQALAIDPCHADAWFNKGMILKKIGQSKEGSQCIERSIDLYCR